MELPASPLRQTLSVAFEVLKRAPTDCPSKLVAVGASALLVVASAVIARLAIVRPEDAHRVDAREFCMNCPVQPQCKHSLVK
jgi:hypothetical protein